LAPKHHNRFASPGEILLTIPNRNEEILTGPTMKELLDERGNFGEHAQNWVFCEA
jgi:hypothetical protein